MQTLICKKCGTKFKCGSTKDRSCWCMRLPNMTGNFDLADSCLCPDCLTAGQAKAITHQKKKQKAQRQAERDLRSASRAKGQKYNI